MAAEQIFTRRTSVTKLVSGMALLAGVAVTPAMAEPLPIGAATYKTNPVVTEVPKYSQVLPDHVIAGNVVDTLTAPIVGGLSGSITSTVYRNPDTMFLTFVYVVTGGANIVSPIVRATLGGEWFDFDVSDAGADATGSSGTGDPGAEWMDGDPYFLARAPEDGSPAIQWRQGGLGTAIGAGDVSSSIFFVTDAMEWNEANSAFLDTAVTGLARILAPAQVGIIPLPSAAMLGVVGFGVVARRRRGV